MKLDKKGVLKAGILVLLVGTLLFFIVNGILSFAETAEEEKLRLEGELAQLEAQLNVISAGFGVNYSGLICDVSQIKSNNYNCDNLTGYHTVKVLTAGIHNQRFNFSNQIADAHNIASIANVTTNGSINQFIDDSDLVFDGNSVYYLFSSENGKCSLVVVKTDCLMADEVLKIKLRVEEIKERLKELEEN